MLETKPQKETHIYIKTQANKTLLLMENTHFQYNRETACVWWRESMADNDYVCVCSCVCGESYSKISILSNLRKVIQPMCVWRACMADKI